MRSRWRSLAKENDDIDTLDQWFYLLPFIVYVGSCAMHSGSGTYSVKRRGILLHVPYLHEAEISQPYANEERAI